MLIKEIARYLSIFGTKLFFIHLTISHIRATRRKIIIGRRPERASFRNAVEGKGPLSSESLAKQSNDKKVSEEEPTLFTGRKRSVKEVGKLVLKEREVVRS